MKRRSFVKVSGIWDDEINRLSIYAFTIFCVTMFWLKTGNPLKIELSWIQTLLPEIVLAGVVIIHYIFQGINLVLPKRWFGSWHQILRGETWIMGKTSIFTAAWARITYALIPSVWPFRVRQYLVSRIESRHRQGFWIKRTV